MSMEAMRDLLKAALANSLHAWQDEDKLAVACAVTCGKAMAERRTVVGYADGAVRGDLSDEA